VKCSEQNADNFLQVLVMTPIILQRCLSHCFIKMDSIALLIFDECHHAQVKSGHPYAEIMRVKGQLNVETCSVLENAQNFHLPHDHVIYIYYLLGKKCTIGAVTFIWHSLKVQFFNQSLECSNFCKNVHLSGITC